jgi:Tol biopolymer transport system component
VVVADLGESGEGVLENLRTVAQPKCSWAKGAHMHPFLSPDGSKGFFNSDESGILQAYMVQGF